MFVFCAHDFLIAQAIFLLQSQIKLFTSAATADADAVVLNILSVCAHERIIFYFSVCKIVQRAKKSHIKNLN
jgi:hypothetical protein